MAGRPIGIDLGTSNSVVSYFDKGEARIIPNIFNETSIPSEVIFTPDKRFFVGREAKNHSQRYDSEINSVGSIKRQMAATEGFVWRNRRYYPQVVSAMLLADLKRQAEDFLKEKVTEAVICIPCNFGVIQRCAVMEAAEMAGLKVVGILNEAVAASLAYNFVSGNYGYEGTELIFDFGGGTLDIALMEISRDPEHGATVFETRSIEGDEFLGGDDFDDKIIEYIVSETQRAQSFDPIEDQPFQWHDIAKLRIKEAAEKAKRELSSQDSTRIYVPYIRNILGNYQHVDVELSRKYFEKICEDLTKKVLKLIEDIKPAIGETYKETQEEVMKTVEGKRTLKDKILRREAPEETVKEQMTKKHYYLPKFVLTGGSSKMGYLVDEIRRKNRDFKFISREKELVSMGAAIWAAIKQGLCKECLLLQATPKSIGIGLKNDEYKVMIPKNTILPTIRKDNFTTTEDDVKNISITVYEGENEKASLNRRIIDLKFGPLPEAKAGEAKIELSLDLDANNILSVTATDTNAGREIHKTFSTSPYTNLKPEMKAKIKKLLDEWIENKKNRKSDV